MHGIQMFLTVLSRSSYRQWFFGGLSDPTPFFLQSHLPDAIWFNFSRQLSDYSTSVQSKSSVLVIALRKVAVCSTVSAKQLSVKLGALGRGLYDMAFLQMKPIQHVLYVLWNKELRHVNCLMKLKEQGFRTAVTSCTRKK